MIRVLSLAALLLLVLVGARRRPERLQLPDGVRLLFVTGSEFLLVGVLLGPLALNVLNEQVLAALKPFAAIAMGFVGLHYGLQLEARVLRWIPLFYNVAPLAQAMGGALATGVPAFFLLAAFYGPGRETIVASMVLGAAAACSTPAPLDLLSRDPRWSTSRLLLMLRHLAEMGELPALALFGLAVCYRHTQPVIEGWNFALTAQWLAFSVLLGLLFGGLLELLPRVGTGGPGGLVVGGIGATLMFAGASRYLRLSPLFVALIAGILVANVPGPSKRLRRFVANTETPFALFLLLLAGASWSLKGSEPLGPIAVLLLSVAMIALRLVGKGGAGWILARTTHALRNPPSIFGFGLVAQGGISAALALDYLDEGESAVAPVVVTMILLSVILTETIAPWILLKVLSRESPVLTAPEKEL